MVQPWLPCALAGAALLSACEVEREPSPPAPADAPAAPEPRLPVIEPPLDRRGLLQAIAEVGSAYATGQDSTERQTQLHGQQLELRLRLGCPGDAQPTRSIEYRERDRRLRIRIAPEITTETGAISALRLPDVEAVEGFWVYHPWILSGDCPAARPEPPSPSTAAGEQAQSLQADTARELPRVGIAQFYTATDSRTGRRGTRDYEISRQLAADERPRPGGYELVISGRLEKLPDGRVIACSGEAAAGPPSCIVSAHLDRVSVVDPVTGTTLGDWSTS